MRSGPLCTNIFGSFFSVALANEIREITILLNENPFRKHISCFLSVDSAAAKRLLVHISVLHRCVMNL